MLLLRSTTCLVGWYRLLRLSAKVGATQSATLQIQFPEHANVVQPSYKPSKMLTQTFVEKAGNSFRPT